MRIVFICHGVLEQGPAGLTSPMASMRYRALHPARELRRLGHDVRIVVTGPGAWSDAEVAALDCDVAVASKSFNAATSDLARRLRARGARIAVDICDDHFGHPEYGVHFEELIALGDVLVASTPEMALTLKSKAGREAIVVSDPVEGAYGEPRFAPRFPVLRGTWFGNVNSAMSLAEKAAELEQLGTYLPVRLAIVTADAPPVRALVERINREGGKRVQAVFAAWSHDSIGAFLAGSDFIWLTSSGGERERVKSPNRLVEGLWAGRLVVADAVPSYEPFAPFTPLGTGLVKGVLESLNAPPRAEARIREGQVAVARRHASHVIGREWALALGEATEAPLKLQLGAATSLLPGYVHVDSAPGSAARRPDLEWDVENLAPFADGSVDEIVARRVIERFPRNRIAAVLREWARALKPGGKLVIEGLDIAKASTDLLTDAGTAPELERGLADLFGDPAAQSPTGAPRWAYAPASLAALMAEAGLDAVGEETPPSGPGHRWDLRMAARKPGARV